MAIGSVGVEVVPDAEGFWTRFVAATSPGANAAGRKLGAEIRRGVQGELSRDVKVGVKADTTRARADIAALRNNVQRDSHSLIKNLLALSPALVPLGAAAAAAGAELVTLGAVGVLAVTGIKKEIDSATPNGAAFAGIVREMKGDLTELQSVASRGVLRGFEQSAATLQSQLPALNEVIARQSVLLGSVASHVVSGLVGGFQTFAPLLDQVGGSIDRVARRFEAFATGPAGQKFGQTLAADYAKVAPLIDDIATGVGHLIAAAQGTGLGIVTVFAELANVLSSFPTPVLTGIITAFVTFRAAATIQGIANTVGASFAAMGARVQLFGLQNTLASTQAAAAAATTIAAADAEAAAVAAARLAETEAILATQEAAAASAAAVGSSFAAEAEETVAATRLEIAALTQRATVAAETAAASSVAATEAANAQVSAAARVAAAQRVASGGFAAALGPIGLVAGALLTLPLLLDHTSDSAQSAAQSTDTFTQALRQSHGAINESVRASVADSLAKEKAFENARTLGISQKAITDVVLQGTAATRKYAAGVYEASKQQNGMGLAGKSLQGALNKVAESFEAGRRAAKDQEAALLGVGSASGATGVALNNGNVALRAYVDAVKAFNDSADTAADRGKLIGEALRAANGDTISYQSTLVGAAKANQQLVTDFKNLKKGVLDLKTGTLDYHNAAAAPLLADLQGLQDANVKAAAAVYQHEVNTRGGAEAATDAYNVYVKNTRGALIDQAHQLGLTDKQARRFATTYLGIKNSGDLKKKIALLGEDKVAAALKGILEDLDILVGKKPLIPIRADGRPAQNTITGVQRAIDSIRQGRTPGIDANTAAGREKIRELQYLIDHMRGKTVDIITRHINTGSGNADEVRSGNRGPIARASGGYISGPGSGTSDSIPARLSNGEFVINAAQTRKHRALLQSINAGVQGFAKGGEAGGYTGVDYGSGKSKPSGGGSSSSSSSSGGKSGKASVSIKYTFDGTEYSTLAEARKAAEKQFRVNVAVGLRIEGHDLRAFRNSLAKTTSDVRSAAADIRKDLSEIGVKSGDPIAKQLAHDTDQIVKQVSKRNVAAAALAKFKDRYAQLQKDIKAAAVSAFDITGAGTGFDGQQAVTGGNILAQSKQAENRVKLFVADIKALKGKINGTYLSQLAHAGPDSLPQLEALKGLSKADLAAINADRASIASQGASLGTTLGEYFYRDDINAARNKRNAANANISREFKALGDRFEKAVDKYSHRPLVIDANGREIARVVNEENKKKARRH